MQKLVFKMMSLRVKPSSMWKKGLSVLSALALIHQFHLPIHLHMCQELKLLSDLTLSCMQTSNTTFPAGQSECIVVVFLHTHTRTHTFPVCQIWKGPSMQMNKQKHSNSNNTWHFVVSWYDSLFLPHIAAHMSSFTYTGVSYVSGALICHGIYYLHTDRRMLLWPPLIVFWVTLAPSLVWKCSCPLPML